MRGLRLPDRLPRPSAGRVAAAAVVLVAVLGLALLTAGVLRATVLAPERTTTGWTAPAPGSALVDTAPGALDTDGPQVRLEVRAAQEGRRVFVGVARADDVKAFLGQAARTEVTGVDDGRLQVQPHGGEATVPDPATADIWAVAATGSGSATLLWPDAPGAWRMIAAGDGTTPPARVTLSWTRTPQPSRAPHLLGLGAGLLVAAAIAALLLSRRRARPAGALREQAAGQDGGDDRPERVIDMRPYEPPLEDAASGDQGRPVRVRATRRTR